MLTTVTFTGIDRKTNLKELQKLQQDFPFVEFGILISDTAMGNNNRFPDKTLLKQLKPLQLHLSCHLCGKIAKKIIHANDWSLVDKILGKDFSIFERCQLNVNGDKHFIENVTFPKDKEFIIQLKKNTDMLSCYAQHADNIVGFQDNSGGKNIFCDNWMDSTGKFGYAGGLNVDNVIETIELLRIVNDGTFWIDMESSVRTNDWLDIDKCRQVCEKVAPYVGK